MPRAASSAALAADRVKPPVQERSRRTLERIVVAAMAVLDETGFKGASMAEIASRAGISVATLYTRFRDKEALLDHLFSNLQSTHLETARELFRPDAWTGISVAERIDHLAGHLVAGAAAHRGLLRALSQRQLLEERTPAEVACEEEMSTLLAEWLQDGARQEGRELPEEPARAVVSLLTSSVRTQVVFGITCGLPRDAFVEQLVSALRSYVDAACTHPGDAGAADE